MKSLILHRPATNRLVLITLAIFCIGLIVRGQTTIYSEDFETNTTLSGWTHNSTNWGTSPVWAQTDTNGNQSLSSMAIHDGPYFGAVSSWVQSPVIDLSQAQNASLIFDLAMAAYTNMDTNAQYSISVWYTTGGNWNFMASFGGPNSTATTQIGMEILFNGPWGPEDNDYVTISIDLSQFPTNDPNFRFSFGSDCEVVYSSGSAFIDNIRIEADDPTSVKEGAFDDLEVWPNPATDLVSVRNIPPGVESVSLLDAQGRVVFNESVLNTGMQIDLSPLEEGVYFLRLQGAHLSETRQLIHVR